MKKILSISLILLSLFVITACDTLEFIQTDNTQDIETIEDPSIAFVALDWSDLDSDDSLLEFWCNDKIIFKEIDGELSPKQVLETMFSYSDYNETNGYYNVFINSELTVSSLEIDSKNNATVKLSGNLSIGWICDTPRVSQQIISTLTNINSKIEKVEIFINWELIEDYLSEKDEEFYNKEIDEDEKETLNNENEINSFLKCARNWGEVSPGRSPNTCTINGKEFLENLRGIESYSECVDTYGSIIDDSVNPKKCTEPDGEVFYYDAMVDDPFVYEEPPVAEMQSFILTHNGKMWQDVCIENQGNINDIQNLMAHLQNTMKESERNGWINATKTEVRQVDSCPAKYDVSCDFIEKSISANLDFNSKNPSNGDVDVEITDGKFAYRVNYAPISYDTENEKKFIQITCGLQENKVQGIENKLDTNGEWK